MGYLPIVIAFVIAIVGAAVVGMGSGASWGAILVGATLAAAMTGLVTSVMQFVPQRVFLPFTILAGAAVAMLVSAAMRAVGQIGFRSIDASTVFVWAVAAIVALMLSRASGMGLPPLRRRRTMSRRS